MRPEIEQTTTQTTTSRRAFLEGLAATTLIFRDRALAQQTPLAGIRVPSHLKGYEKQYRQSPRAAALEWFHGARLGLMVHYGLYSLDGIHPFQQHRLKIPVREYAQRMERFTAEKFSANQITDLALEVGMKYVTLVTKHCEGFCLWDTRQTDFNSVRSAAKRDLVKEMSEACAKRGLGFFPFYEHGFEWRHPHGPRYADFPVKLVEVPYTTPEPSYAHGADYNLQNYVDYVHAQITELLTKYGAVAGIWLDGAIVPNSGDKSRFHLPELYDHIHRLQPHALISYKWGVTGGEDFFGPERPQLKMINNRGSKPMELNIALNKSWGYVKGEPHIGIDEVMERLAEARQLDANLVLNIGPLSDGSIPEEDLKTLREFGRRLKRGSVSRLKGQAGTNA